LFGFERKKVTERVLYDLFVQRSKFIFQHRQGSAELDEQESTVDTNAAGAPRPLATWTCPACNLKIPTTTAICPQDGTTIDAQKEMDPALAEIYEFIGTIGTGGMGVIYKARQKMLNKIVAIKMLHSHLLNVQSMLRFQQEAKAASSLRHPNVISVHDFGISEQGQPYMVMDYIEGTTLADLLRKDGALPLPDAMDIFLAVCEALEHAHEHGVLHRDLKSSNIMLSKKEGGYNVHLLDFGIAKIIDTESGGIAQQLTQTGELIGSPLYMSPEQCMGKKVDNRTDIYSLGCILYEAVTGNPPHCGDTMIETIFKHLNETPLTLHQARPDINFPETFDNLVMKLLASKPEDRVQSISQVKAELLNIQSGALKGGFTQKAATAWSKFKFSRTTAAITMAAILATIGLVSLSISNSNLERTAELKNESNKQLSQADALRKQAFATKEDDDAPKLNEVSADKLLVRLRQVPNDCQDLDLSSSKVNDQILWSLPRFTQLNSLDLSKTSITDDAIKPLSKLKGVTTLTLSDTALSPEALAQLASLTGLKKLYLDSTAVDDSDLRAFSGLPGLKHLDVRDTDISDHGLEFLPTAKNLETLSISGTSITNRGISAISKLKLIELNMWDTHVSAGVVEQLKECKSLTSLSLSRLNLSAGDIIALSELPSLNYLQLYHIKNLEDEDLLALTKLKALTKLYIEDCPLSDGAATYLNQMHQLEGLSVNECAVTDRLIAQIGDLQNLKQMWLENTKVRDFKQISKLRKLESLKISGTPVTDSALKEIATLPNLDELEIRYCPNLSRPAIAAFKKLKPRCDVVSHYSN